MDVRKVTGILRHWGPNVPRHINPDNPEASGASDYAYLRIDEPNGEAVVVDHVSVSGHIVPFLPTRETGISYFACIKHGKFERNVLIAVSAGGRRSSDLKYLQYLISETKWAFRKALFMYMALIVGGLLAAIILVGIPIALWGLYLLVRLLVKSHPSKYPDVSICRQALLDDGFQA